jgi:hypothetical protein
MVTLMLEIDRAEYAAIPAGETPRFSAALGTIAPTNCRTQGPWRLCHKSPDQHRYRYGSTRNRRGRDPVKFADSSPCELAFKLRKLCKNSRKLVHRPLGPSPAHVQGSGTGEARICRRHEGSEQERSGHARTAKGGSFPSFRPS